MNTQLILYPQNYKGYSTQSGFLGQEFLIDGNDFTTIMASDIATAISAVPLPATYCIRIIDSATRYWNRNST